MLIKLINYISIDYVKLFYCLVKTFLILFKKLRCYLIVQQYVTANGWDTNVTELIHVNIYFPTTEETVVTTSETNPLFTLIANVGGQMGEY